MRNRSHRRRLIRCSKTAASAMLYAALAALPSVAQPAPQRAQVEVPDATSLPLDPNAKESLQGVSVNDSPEARKDIETARGMERQKDWNKAASWYQDVLEKYRNRVVAYRADKRNTINVYRGIIYQVQEALAKWPPEGIAAYRAKYETTAANMLAGAAPDDYETLDTVFKNYFITEAGKQAGMKLIDLHLEEGDFAAAAWIGDRLLDWYPAEQLVVERPRLLYRTALAYHLHGDNKRALEHAEELKKKYADTTGSIFGKDVVFTDALVGQLAVKPPRGAELAPDSYPMFCGSPDRSHVSSAKGRMGAKIFSIDLPPRPARPDRPNGSDPRRPVADREDQGGMSLGIMPVVDGDQLFFQDGSRIYAVSLESGVPLPGWANTYGGERKGRYLLKGSPSPRTQQQTITVTETSVLAVMGQSNRAAFVLQQQGQEVANNGERGTRLVCLDRETGKERWKVTPAAIADEKLKDEDRERVRSLDLSGSPLVVGDSVYVIGRGGKDPQFENCYVLAFDLATGKYKWSSLVASANSNFNAYDENAVPSNTLSHLAYSSGRLYVLTNLGALAAIDAYNGSVVWLTIYPREVDNVAMNQLNFRGRMAQNIVNQQQLKPWEFNPVFVQNGKLFAMPLDSKFLIVYDAGNGSEIKSIDLGDFDRIDGYERPTTLLAILNEKVLLSGRHQVLCLDWEKYDITRSLPQNLTAAGGWATPTFRRTGGPLDPIRGRAFVTADSVFLPTDLQLLRLSLRRDGAAEEDYPLNGHWDSDTQGPGNVLVTSEHVVLAAANRIDVYTDMKLALAKLDREVAAVPKGPEPRLKYAEVMFAAGQLDLALSKMKEGIELTGGTRGMRPGATRQRVFADCLAFAQKLGREKRGESNDMAVQFYDLAAAAADAASEQVNYRISRAQFLRETSDFTQSVRLYQQILSHPDLRVVATVGTDDSGGNLNMVQASFFAEGAINKVLQTHPEAYAPVQAEALAARDAARATANPDKLLAVAQTYPNATAVAPAAMLEAAELYEKAKSPRLATHVLRQIYRKYGASDDRANGKPATNLNDRAKIVEALVRNYLTLPGGYDVATARLQQGIAKPLNLGDTKLTQPLVLPGGQKIENVTFAEALDKLKAARPEAVAEQLPDFRIPPYRRLTEAEQDAGKRLPDPFLDDKDDPKPVVLNDVAVLLAPTTELSRYSRADRLVTANGNNVLSIYAAGQNTPLHSNSDLTDPPRAIAWMDSAPGAKVSNLLAWSAKEVLLASGDTGSTLWKCELEKLPAIEVVATTGPQEGASDEASGAGDVAVAEQPAQAFNGRRAQMLGRRGRGVIAVNGVAQVQAAENAQPAAVDGPEQVSFVQPLGDRVIVATSTGRLICLGSADGKVLWQTRLINRPYERLVACEDFTVVRFTDNNTAYLLAVDNHDGQVQMKKGYTLDGGNIPINVALSPDGMLVWTLSDRICGKDLYEAGNTPKFEFPREQPANQASPQFVGCSRPGQLLIEGDKIIAVEQGGRFVSIRDLQTGALSRHLDKGKPVDSLLGTGYETREQQGVPAEVPVWVRIGGRHLYVVGPRSLMAYSLDHPADDHWNGMIEKPAQPNIRDLFLSRDYLILLDEPGARRRGENNNTPLYRLHVYTRSKVGAERVESGVNVDDRTVVDPNGITQWQATDGGVYVLSGDHKLRLIKGAAGMK